MEALMVVQFFHIDQMLCLFITKEDVELISQMK